MPKMSRLLCALYYTFVFVYSHCLLVQVNQYMLACMLSVDVALICRPACFSLLFYCRPYWRFLLSCCSVLLTVVLFCHLNGHLILSSFSVVLTVVLFFGLVLSSLLSSYFVHLILSSCSVVLFCRLKCHHILSSSSVVLFCRLNSHIILSSCSVVLNVIIFCRLVLSSCSVILTVVLLCRPNCHLQNKNKISHVSLVSRNILQPLEHEKKPIGKLL